MKHSNIQKSKEIHLYIVGFPKSGTSWLARLMANLLRIPIKNNQNNTEATVEINRRLHLQYKGSFIAKVHLLPQYLIPQIDPQLSRIIYIQ
ncbi:MAG TPA: hypothetical protein ENJ45_05485, partial [Phaeodactylibacter sp.]|nr:hypothetical protein [Phaeodactylibacter sp.]